jgi:Heterokaryon incompatibility protein (HET)
MRLLNTESMRLEEFHGSNIPPYAILSHTWGKEEVSFQDLVGGDATKLRECKKIIGCRNQAVSDGYRYIWVDTCCIDKTSSAELSEAINSMFCWYREAEVCYAYLADVDIKTDLTHLQSAIEKSRWFTRGWTLQELVAPSDVVFYDSDWAEIGTKTDLAEIISNVTGIGVTVLLKGKMNNFDDYSVAKRMFWASKRMTTRVEDEAYCLMGLFGVNMPLLYGENQKAFFRLQEEIMKRSDDHSLFAWKASKRVKTGLLASSPQDFSISGGVDRRPIKDDNPYSITNKGVQITLPLLHPPGDGNLKLAFSETSPHAILEQACRPPDYPIPSTNAIAMLNCRLSEAPNYFFGIVLEQQNHYGSDNFYLRDNRQFGLILLNPRATVNGRSFKQIFVPFPKDRKVAWNYGCNKVLKCAVTLPLVEFGFQIHEIYPRSRWHQSVSNPQAFDLYFEQKVHDEPVAILFDHMCGYHFAVLLFSRCGKVHGDIIVDVEKAMPRVTQNLEMFNIRTIRRETLAGIIVASQLGRLKPRDRVIQPMNNEVAISLEIRRSPTDQSVLISAQRLSEYPHRRFPWSAGTSFSDPKDNGRRTK